MRSTPTAAIIGVSGYGRIYLERVLHHVSMGDIRLVAATIINPGEESPTCANLSDRGCVIYDDYRRMLADFSGQLDLVLIPTGIPWHTRMTLAALQAGAHVLVEKPLASQPEEIAEILAASRRARRFVAVGFQLLYHESATRVRDLIISGAIGRVRTARAFSCWPRTSGYYRRNSWAGRVFADSALVWDSPINNGLSHFLLLALWWTGIGRPGDAATAEVELYRAQTIESYDTAALRLTNGTGSTVLFSATHSALTSIGPIITIEGDRGLVVWRHDLQTCQITTADGSMISIPVPDETECRRCMFEGVVRRLTRPEGFICTPELAALHAEWVAAAHSSGPIHDVPDRYVATEEMDGATTQTYIPGIESALRRAFDAGQMPGELGFPWARPASKVGNQRRPRDSWQPARNAAMRFRG